MKDKHEFRFVVEGIELSQEEAAAIGDAIREAGLLAVSRSALAGGGLAITTAAAFDRPRWDGGYVRRLLESQLADVARPKAKVLQQ